MFAAVALVGCNREDVPVSPQEQHAISFDNVSTRAGLSDLQANGFGVWATVSSIGSTDVSYQPLFEEEERVYIPDGGTDWTYDNEQLWISNSIFHFFAAYPYNIGFEQVRFEYGGKYLTACYKEMSADGATEPVDILVATYETDTTDENFDPNNAVPLLFKHLHTKVNFKIRQNFDADPSFNYYVTKVTLRAPKTVIPGEPEPADEGAIYSKGICMYMPYSQPENQISWAYVDMLNPQEEYPKVVISKEYSEPRILRNIGVEDPTVTLSVWGDGIMLIPQEIAANSLEVVVDYIYDVSVDTDYKDGTPKQAKAVISNIKWESNKSICYNLAISNTTSLTFDKPTIEPWGSPQTGGTIIIK